jgi:hypothetical protein
MNVTMNRKLERRAFLDASRNKTKFAAASRVVHPAVQRQIQANFNRAYNLTATAIGTTACMNLRRDRQPQRVGHNPGRTGHGYRGFVDFGKVQFLRLKKGHATAPANK